MTVVLHRSYHSPGAKTVAAEEYVEKNKASQMGKNTWKKSLNMKTEGKTQIAATQNTKKSTRQHTSLSYII